MKKDLTQDIIKFINVVNEKSISHVFRLSGFDNEIRIGDVCSSKLCPISTERDKGYVKVWIPRFNKFSKEFRFFLMVWAMNRYGKKSDLDADKIALKEYKKMGYSKKKLADGFTELVKNDPNNKERINLVLGK